MIRGVPVFALIILGGWVLVALAGDRMVDPQSLSIDLEQVWCPSGPAHWLGCDELGRDVLSRLVLAASASFAVAASATVLSLLLGGGLGLLAGYTTAWPRRLVGFSSAVCLAFPRLILAMAIGAALTPGMTATAVAFALVAWPSIALPTRDQITALQSREFVRATTALGGTRLRLLFRHLLPHLWPVWLARSGGLAAQAILVDAALSFLGLGAPDERPSWGAMIRDGLPFLHHAPAAALAAGGAIFITALAANLLADRLAAQHHYR